jgi:hypothetical protein
MEADNYKLNGSITDIKGVKGTLFFSTSKGEIHSFAIYKDMILNISNINIKHRIMSMACGNHDLYCLCGNGHLYLLRHKSNLFELIGHKNMWAIFKYTGEGERNYLWKQRRGDKNIGKGDRAT